MGVGLQSEGGGASERLTRLIRVLWVVVFLGVAGAIQNLTPNYVDGDTGYHLAVAGLIRKYGILQSFPWTPFSWLADHYADKELLFHLALVPLSGLDSNLAARVAGTLLGAGLLGTLYLIMLKERVEAAGWWTLLALASSSAFIYRFALVRPHMLSIPLALLITWAAARRRLGVLAACCFIYPFCYTAWHLPLVLIGIVEVVRLLEAHEDSPSRPSLWRLPLLWSRIEWRTIAIALAALCAGIALHPNFPANLDFFRIQNYTVLFGTAWAGKAGFEQGGEFSPFSALGLLKYVALPAIIAVSAAVFAWRRRRDDPLPLSLAVTSLAFALLTLRTQRFIEYLAPFAALALALAWRPQRRRFAAPALVAIGALWIGLLGRHPLELLRERIEPFPTEVAAALQDIVPVGEQVVTCEWHITGEMMLALPERRFMVALDPVLLAVNDPERYALWFETIQDPPENAGTLLRDAFDARFVICDSRVKWLPLMQSLERDVATRFRGIFGFWVVFELLPEPQTPSPLGGSVANRVTAQ